MERLDDAEIVTTEDIDALAEQICARGLETPAVFFLEAHRPLRGLLFQASLVSAPLLHLFVGRKNSLRIQAALEDPKLVDQLLESIEARRSKSKLKEPV